MTSTAVASLGIAITHSQFQHSFCCCKVLLFYFRKLTLERNTSRLSCLTPKFEQEAWLKPLKLLSKNHAGFLNREGLRSSD